MLLSSTIDWIYGNSSTRVDSMFSTICFEIWPHARCVVFFTQWAYFNTRYNNNNYIVGVLYSCFHFETAIWADSTCLLPNYYSFVFIVMIYLFQ